MALLQFVGTMAFVAVVLLSLIAVFDVLALGRRAVSVAVADRSAGSGHGRRLARGDERASRRS